MRYVFIPVKEVFANSITNVDGSCSGCADFINHIADERAKRKYNVAIIPASLMKELEEKNYFKQHRTAELVRAFVDVDESVLTSSLVDDYFELARINADKQPIIVAHAISDINPGQHTTPIINAERALSFSKESESSF